MEGRHAGRPRNPVRARSRRRRGGPRGRAAAAAALLAAACAQAPAPAPEKPDAAPAASAIPAEIPTQEWIDRRVKLELGRVLLAGDPAPGDYARAAALWREVVEAGGIPPRDTRHYMAAHNNLAYLLYYGLGVDADPAQALQLWRIAAEHGHSEAQKHLGFAYSDGSFLEVDLVEAYAWLASAAARADARAEEDAIQRAVGEDARERLVWVARRLGPAERAEADRRAADYIMRHRNPLEGSPLE